jgi:hypothetical protein
MPSWDKAQSAPAPLRWPYDGSISASDPRADGERREILFESRRVIIKRALRGMPMAVCIPFAAFRGLGLCLADSPNGIVYELRLVHVDADLSVVLSHCRDEEDAVGHWLQLAGELGVPRLVERRIGDFEPIGSSCACVSRPAPRRRCATLRARHGRFALRRKQGLPARLATCFAGEREIISYE